MCVFFSFVMPQHLYETRQTYKQDLFFLFAEIARGLCEESVLHAVSKKGNKQKITLNLQITFSINTSLNNVGLYFQSHHV